MFAIHQHLHVSDEFAQAFLLEEYMSHMRIQGMSPNSVESYTDFLERFIRFSGLKDYKDFDSFIKIKYGYYGLMKRKVMNSTLLKYYKIVKKYSQFLKDNELVEKVHINQIPRVRVPASLPKSLTEEDIKRIRKVVMTMRAQSPFIQMRNAVMIETFLYTGIRREELIRLRKDNVFRNHILIQQGKGQKDRIIYIPEHFSRQILDWIELQNKNPIYVFCDNMGLPLTGNAVSCMVKRIEAIVGFKLHPHLLRHTYASLCVKK